MGGWEVAGSSEYLAIASGKNIIKVTRSSWVWPHQKCVRLDTSRVKYSLDVEARSFDKLRFIVPVRFTISPRLEPESLKLYAERTLYKTSKPLRVLIAQAIERETKQAAANRTLEQILEELNKEFRDDVAKWVQRELDDYGHSINSFYVKEPVNAFGDILVERALSDSRRMSMYAVLESRKKEDIIEEKKAQSIEGTLPVPEVNLPSPDAASSGVEAGMPSHSTKQIKNPKETLPAESWLAPDDVSGP
ncbi:hypothetical protein Tsubulata_047531, partial [Turnera subulata]